MLARLLNQIIKKNIYLPAQITFYITSQSNTLDELRFNKNKIESTTADLNLSEIEKTFETLKNVSAVDLAGGEPFLREDIVEICAVLCKSNVPDRIRIITNGINTAVIESQVRQILKKVKVPLTIILSLDNLNSNQDELTGVSGGFDSLLETYKKLTLLKNHYPSLSCEISTIIYNKNIDKIQDIINFVKEELPQIDFHHIAFIDKDQENQKNRLPHINSLEARKTFILRAWEYYNQKKQATFIKKWFVRAVYNNLIETYLTIIKNQKMTLSCYAGKTYAVIYPDGRVGFCSSGAIIDNLRDYQFNFPRLWYSYKARESREAIKQKTCFCNNETAVFYNILSDFRLYPSLLKNLFVN